MFTKHILFIIILVFTLLPVQLQAEEPTGRELAQQVYDYDIGDNSIAQMTMVLEDDSGRKRERRLINMTMDEGNIRKTMIRFLEPADIAGTGFLSIEQEDGSTEQFLYLPALDRTRRIVADQKGRSFVNSDFTYEDMQRRPVENYEHTMTGQEEVQGHDCWILEERPLPKANSEYSFIKNWVPKDIPIPVQAHFFADQDEHIKTYKVSELEKIQGIWTPMRMVMIDHEDQHRTILSTEEIQYNSPDIQDSFFSTRYLESW